MFRPAAGLTVPAAAPVADFRRAARMGHAKYFDVATIAHVLASEADKFVGSQTVVSIVGNDLPNVAKEEYPWAATLQEWLKRGAIVRYLAIDPAEKALDKLRMIAAGAAPGKLEVRRLNRASLPNDGTKKLATMWRTHHFVVFDDPKNPQFWVETFHPPVFTEARDCFYFGPQHVAESAQFDLCRSEFDFMFHKYGDVLV